jgi:ribosome-associated translation inhibitor RaiA
MQVQINFGDVQKSDAVASALNDQLNDSLRLFRDRITRVEVHLRDDNGPKAGVDKRCLLEARLAGMEPLAVEARGTDIYQVIIDAAGKLERAIRHKIERHDERTERHNPREKGI